jgi:mRNA-degrading endonuclease toxin of MazEF toxin-antitoxin module
MARYVADAGDIVWLKVDPQAGRVKAGHRPAFVLSPSAYATAVQASVRIVGAEHTIGCSDAEAHTVRKNYLAQADC